MRTGQVNLLEKLPLAAEKAVEKAEQDRREKVAKYLVIATTLLSFVAGASMWKLMDFITPGDWAAGAIYTMMGLIAGPFYAAVAFAVLTNFDIRIRAFALIATICMLLAANRIGMTLSQHPGRYGNLELELAPAIPILLLAAAIPFITVKHALGWQIIFPRIDELPKRQKTSITSMLILTAIIAACIATVQMTETPVWWAAAAMLNCGAAFAAVLPVFLFQMKSRSALLGLLGGYLAIFVIAFGITFSIGSSTGNLTLADSLGTAHAISTGVLVVAIYVAAIRGAGGELATNADVVAAELNSLSNSK